MELENFNEQAIQDATETAKEVKENPVEISDELKKDIKKITNSEVSINFLNKNKYVTNAAIVGAIGGLIYGYASKRNMLISSLIGGVGLGFIVSLIKK
jgi:DNA replicative helicase MCM subunit Mcm2 (Cdc46/Mcm family)